MGCQMLQQIVLISYPHVLFSLSPFVVFSTQNLYTRFLPAAQKLNQQKNVAVFPCEISRNVAKFYSINWVKTKKA